MHKDRSNKIEWNARYPHKFATTATIHLTQHGPVGIACITALKKNCTNYVTNLTKVTLNDSTFDKLTPLSPQSDVAARSMQKTLLSFHHLKL